MVREKIRVLVAEDSPVVQMLLVHVLNSDPDIQVVGTAADGLAAVEFVTKQRPDVVLMDIHMPNMDGFEATRRIMEKNPLPIVICSATMKSAEVENTFRALEAGAIASVEKPVGMGSPDFDSMVGKVVQTIKDMAGVRFGRRAAATRQGAVAPHMPHAPIKLVVIGSSTGGPPVLQTILAGLPKNFPVPVLIVQHIAAGFLDGMVEWFRKHTLLDVHIAKHNERLRSGCVFIAPDGFHMGIAPDGCVQLSDREPENGLRPSVAHLFRTASDAYGASVAAILLTGMGRDGADEMKRIKDRGGFTIAQDRESSVVHGMAGEAIKLDAVTQVLPPGEIAAALIALARPASLDEAQTNGRKNGA